MKYAMKSKMFFILFWRQESTNNTEVKITDYPGFLGG
jgi:hypothetical protein